MVKDDRKLKGDTYGSNVVKRHVGRHGLGFQKIILCSIEVSSDDS
jgi:hypothetical protein